MAEQSLFDQTTQACFQFDPTKIPVLGDDTDLWKPGVMGAEKVLTSVRRTQFAVSFTQAAGVGSDLVAAAQTINLLAFGGPVANLTGNANALATNGFPAALGNITYAQSNVYPNGLLCQPEYEFVILGMSVRPVSAFEIPVAAPVKTYSPWIKAYQAAAQQAIIENSSATYQRNRETCQVLLENLAQYPSNFSSGQPLVSSQNGEPLKGNVIPLCAGLPVAAESGTAIGAGPNAQFNMTTGAITLANDAFNQPKVQLIPTAPLVVPMEVIWFGYCRDYCPPTNCLPGGGRRPRAQTPG